jgi:uncharacterized membrane protein
MHALVRALGPAALIAGVALLVETLATGAAHLTLVVVVPVFTGSTPLFGLAAVLLVVGLFSLPLLFAGPDETATVSVVSDAPTPPRAGGGTGGLVLLGPVPIFWGAWRQNPPISYRWAIFVGAILLVVAIFLLWGLALL